MSSINNTQFPISMETGTLGNANIKVIGVGGGGGNAVNNMILNGMKNVGFIAANTDTQVLQLHLAETKIQLGSDETRGLGAGGNPKVGFIAAEESKDQIKEVLKNTDMLFITAGMGGGTGTGATSVIAKIARAEGILVVAIVNTPFSYEGRGRLVISKVGVNMLAKEVDAMIIISNDKVRMLPNQTGTSFKDTLAQVDQVLFNGVRGIVDIIDKNAYINTDFNDVRAVMQNSGNALMGIGMASGEERAIKAVDEAIYSPLLDDLSIEGAKSLLVNITAGNLEQTEIDTVMMYIREKAGYSTEPFDLDKYNDVVTFDDFGGFDDIDMPENDRVYFGANEDPDLGDKLQVTIIATGLTEKAKKKAPQIINEPVAIKENNKIRSGMLVADVVEEPVKEKVLVSSNQDKQNFHKPPVTFRGLNNGGQNHNGSRSFNAVPRGNGLNSLDTPATIRNKEDAPRRNMFASMN